MGRSEIEKKYEGFIKNKGSKALPWLCFTTTEGIKGSIAKFFSETDLQELKTLTGIKE
jgi:aspartyl-tRNA synthetase